MAARVAGAIGHDEARPACGLQGRVEQADPEVVGVIDAGQPEREASLYQSRLVHELRPVDLGLVEGRVRHHIVEAANQFMRVIIVAVCLADVAREAMDCEAQPAQADRVGHLLDAEDADLPLWGLVVSADERGRVDEHPARSAGRVEDRAMVGFDNLHDQLHDGGRREILAALLHEGRGELPHEVLEDQSVSVALDLQRSEQAQQLPKRVVGQSGVTLRDDASQVRVGLCDGLHGSVQFGAKIRRAGQREQPGEAGVLGQEDRAAGLIVCGLSLEPAGELWGQLGVDRLEPRLHLTQRDQGEDGLRVLIRTEGTVGPELISRGEHAPR
jgi:hypothetical protein